VRRLEVARRAARTTNLLERLFGEERRRTKVIPRAFCEGAVLKLMIASLLPASAGWRRVIITEFELRQLEELRNELDQEFRQRTTASVSVASRHRNSNKYRT
jgi:transposase-like protein